MSPTVCQIFKYHITLLHTKIGKTHKKVSSVVSPVSVSPGRYSVLSVDSMDCDLPTIFNVVHHLRGSLQRAQCQM